MPTYTISGGTPLFGSVRLGGAKNASYKLMIAALLADSPSRLLNFSHISDVEMVARIIKGLGAKAQMIGDRAYGIYPTPSLSHEIGKQYGEVSRASTLFIPVLLHRTGKAVVPQPGGDKIGVRPLERHFDGLRALGARIEIVEDSIVATCQKLHGARYRFEKNTHTGTETLLMAAVLARGHTILENAAEETEIDDLIAFLNLMGGKIKRHPGRLIEIEGVEKLSGAIFKIMPDQNQAVSFACAALATKGDIVVENARKRDLTAFLDKLDAIGAGYEGGAYGMRFFYTGELNATDVETQIHPGFKTDWQPLWVTLMTQARGVSVLHETVSQSRFGYTQALRAMGATIELFNPPVKDPEKVYNFNITDRSQSDMHAARITGPTPLRGGEFAVEDLRHGATLMTAGLVASGTTVIHDPLDHIGRGYEELDTQFRNMGAKITRTT